MTEDGGKSASLFVLLALSLCPKHTVGLSTNIYNSTNFAWFEVNSHQKVLAFFFLNKCRNPALLCT